MMRLRACRSIDRRMPRPLRFVLPGHTLHVIQRGNNRGPCFIDDEDRERYLAALLRASDRVRCAIHAYVLMSNHTHLLVTAADASAAARMMQAMGPAYVRYFNRRHGRTGTLWEGRYRSGLIDSERYFLQCSRYIEMNPVWAGIVNDPGAYRWSSFGSNAQGASDLLVRRHPVYLALGRENAARREAYRALFDTSLDGTMVDAIRRATNKGVALGGDDRVARPPRQVERRASQR
jgi:REP-associated tyrosine transposase